MKPHLYSAAMEVVTVAALEYFFTRTRVLSSRLSSCPWADHSSQFTQMEAGVGRQGTVERLETC
jgi:hypothetical protein